VLGVTYEGSKELNAVSMLTGVSFRIEFDVPSKRRNLRGTHRPPSYRWITYDIPRRVIIMEQDTNGDNAVLPCEGRSRRR
jgi:hypothetical protein